MRTRWKILGGTGIVSIGVVAFIVGQTGSVRGDTTTASPNSSAAAPSDKVDPATFVDPTPRDPFAPYPSPGAIPYEELSAAEKVAVDRIPEVVETSGPPASPGDAYARATAWTSADADRQIAERQMGLQETANDGVVP
jgi:hypothetical protein